MLQTWSVEMHMGKSLAGLCACELCGTSVHSIGTDTWQDLGTDAGSYPEQQKLIKDVQRCTFIMATA